MRFDPLLSRRRFVGLSAGMLAAPSLSRVHPAAAAPPAPAALWPGYSRAVVIDYLASPGPFNTPDRMVRLTPEMVRNAAASGITAVNLTVSGGDVEQTFRNLALWEREIETHPEVLMRVASAGDLAAAKESGRLGLIYGFQNTSMIETDLSRVELFRSFGVRIVQLTYNVRNLVGDGCLEKANGGLSNFGRDLVAELNRQRVVVDLSHCGQRTTADAIAASSRPVAISHSGCAALADLPRNKRDEELRAMAEKGGVVGIYLMPFLAVGRPPRADDVVLHIEHALRVCGEDHVGIGSDLSITPHVVDDAYRAKHTSFVAGRQAAGIAAPGEDPEIYMFVADLNTPRRLELIADRLLARGHTEARVEKIVGGNLLRLSREVWGG